MTQADDRILESLEESGMVLSPRILAVNTEYSRHYVSERLALLLDRGLVEKEDEGLYRITDQGHAYLTGDLDADALEREE